MTTLWAKVKARKTRLYYLDLKKVISDTQTAIIGSGEWQKLKELLKSDWARVHFLPERRILLKSLDIADLADRDVYLQGELSSLYKALNHTP